MKITRTARLTGAVAAAAFTLFSVGVSSAFAGTTPWFDRDNPGGDGDWETTADLLRIECRIKPGTPGAGTPVSGPGYACTAAGGGICTNANTVPVNTCKDIETRYLWSGGSTPWFDRDNPSGVGDWETTIDNLNITCGKVPSGAAPVGAGYVCVENKGGICQNALTSPVNSCVDMRVQYSW